MKNQRNPAIAPFKVGDRIRLRDFPHITGTIWDVSRNEDMVIVDWNDPDERENVYVTNPQRWLEKITE
jgi:hypothetical protein